MAWESPGHLITLPCVTTGIPRYSFVNVSTAGRAIYTTLGGTAVGVVQDGTTNSTVDPTSITVMVSGVSKVRIVSSSTVGVGEIISASSRGSIVASTAAAKRLGQIIAGTSGGANRIVSVLLATPVGNSTS